VISTLHIVVAMKPLEGNFTQNALRHGVAGINVDGCRVAGETPSVDRRKNAAPGVSVGATGWTTPARPPSYNEQRPGEQLGRWPANVILEDNDEIVAEFPSPLPQGGVHKKSVGKIINNNVFGKGFKRTDDAFYGDSGSASRFFKQVKEE